MSTISSEQIKDDLDRLQHALRIEHGAYISEADLKCVIQALIVEKTEDIIREVFSSYSIADLIVVKATLTPKKKIKELDATRKKLNTLDH